MLDLSATVRSTLSSSVTREAILTLRSLEGDVDTANAPLGDAGREILVNSLSPNLGGTGTSPLVNGRSLFESCSLPKDASTGDALGRERFKELRELVSGGSVVGNPCEGSNCSRLAGRVNDDVLGKGRGGGWKWKGDWLDDGDRLDVSA